MATILDLTRFSASYGPRLLAEAGHRVIRVEPPDGDDVRRRGPFLRATPDLEHGAYHQFLNAGKESVTLDPRVAGDRETLLALIRRVDAAIVSRPFDVDSAALIAANPQLVLVEVDDVPNELTAYATSGLLSLTGHPDQTPVVLGGHAVFSAIGLYVAVAAAAGLLSARLSHAGAHIDVSAVQCMESLAEQAALTYHTTGTSPERRGFRGAITAVSGAFPCADGYWMVSIPHTASGWARLMEWVDDPVLKADASLADESQRLLQRDFILDRLSAWSKKHPKDELVAQAQARHIPASPVATALDLAADPQLLARSFLREIDHPLFGRIRFPVGAVAGAKHTPLAPAPRLGEHTIAVISEFELNAPPVFEQVAVGDELPQAVFGPLTIDDTVRWAGSQEIWERLHFDREFAREHSGQTTFIASGAYRQAMLARSLTDWIGPRGTLRKLRIRQAAPTLEGDTMRFSGSVVEKSADATDPWIACDLEGHNQRGERIVIASCVVTLAVRAQR